MMPVFDNLLSKLSQVNLSDLNHELGKAKENIVFESGSVLENFRSAASTSGSLIRSESTRFGNFLGGRANNTGLPKSTSLPVLAGVATSPSSDCGPCRSRGTYLGSKYKYRSTSVAEEDKPIVSPQDLLDEESVINRFIKVVGADEPVKKISLKEEERGLNSREEIRKKLASWGEEDEEEEEEEEGRNNNLEICFINETASDEEEELVRNPLFEQEELEEEKSRLSRSKSEGVCLRADERKAPRTREEKRNKEIQSAARLALGQCGTVARRQMIAEKQRRNAKSRLKNLLGTDGADLTPSLLSTYNFNTLQVIVNDFRERIEQHNAELVQMLMDKDELQNEQESQLMDIEDLSSQQ